MATKRKKGPVWEYTVRRAGVLPRPAYLRFADEREGDEYVRRLEALLDRGIVPDALRDRPSSSNYLRDHVRSYLAAQHVSTTDADCLRIVTHRLPANLALPQLTFVWATEWVTKLKREENLSPTTIRHHVGALARALDWLASRGDLPFNPLRLLPRGYSTYTPADIDAARAVAKDGKQAVERDRRLAADEEHRIRAILAGAKPAGRQRALELREGPALVLLFDLALESAMRLREMFTLSVAQVDLPRSTIFLDKTKNGSKRQVPITSVAARALEAHQAPGPLLFPWWDGNPSRESLERTTSRLSRQFGRIFEAAGCPDLNFHDLRHEATSRLYERTTLTDLQIASITGHRDPRMLRRYANLRGSTLAARLW
jgi:integrase